MEKIKLSRSTNFLDKEQTLIARVSPTYFKHLYNIISDTITYLQHVRETTPNPSILDTRLRNLNSLENELARAIEADKFVIDDK